MTDYCNALECWQKCRPYCLMHRVATRSFGPYSAKWSYEQEVVPDVKKQIVCMDQTGETTHLLDKKAVKVQFFKDSAPTYSLWKNSYHTEDDDFMLLEWFSVDGRCVFVFNDEHGCLGVFDAETGSKLHESDNNDIFVTDYKMFDDGKFLYISGWIWQPFAARAVFHIPTLLQQPGYEPTPVTTVDTDDEMYPGVSLLGCKSCGELLEKHDEIQKTIGQRRQCELFNRNRSDDILLRRLLREHSSTLLDKILSSDRKVFFIETFGNETGENLYLGHAWYYKPCCAEKPWCLDFAQLAWQCVERLPFEHINLRFEIVTDVGNLNIHVRHKLQPCEDKLRFNIHPGNTFYVEVNTEPETDFRER